MELWNEYEGRSIDGLFPLERLIRPEGRSAFFTTTTSGTSTVIRLIESHFDEDEILARWTGVSNLHQPNLLTLTRFGQAMMDETSLVYVVLEPTEADLSQILCDRPLTVSETREVAASLIPALQALHAKGFLHEHILPVNVLAVGEVVKLRSDCIREAPEGPEGDALRARDVQDLALLLLQALTQQRNPAASPTGPPLPAPLREIIQNGVSGNWGLAQMAAALAKTAPQPAKPVQAAPAAMMPTASTPMDLHRRPATDAAGSAQAEAANRSANRKASMPKPTLLPAPQRIAEPAEGRIRVPMRPQTGISPRLLALLALGVLGLMLFAAYTLLHHRGTQEAVTTQPVVSATSQPNATGQPARAAEVVAKPSPAAAVALSESSASGSWRVVAYTYNRQDQAAAKAQSLAQRFADLHPVVFAPTGRAPYLVTLGGPMGRESAFRLRDKLRRSGLPRDLYAQNYTLKRR